MAFIHGGRVFAESYVFNQEELLAVTPDTLKAYLMVKIYDNPEANPDVDSPLNYRLNSLLFWKKAWSYFMVNRNMPWDEVTMRGNPIRCAMMADLIKSIKRMETRRAGKPSQARHALLP